MKPFEGALQRHNTRKPCATDFRAEPTNTFLWEPDALEQPCHAMKGGNETRRTYRTSDSIKERRKTGQSWCNLNADRYLCHTGNSIHSTLMTTVECCKEKGWNFVNKKGNSAEKIGVWHAWQALMHGFSMNHVKTSARYFLGIQNIKNGVPEYYWPWQNIMSHDPWQFRWVCFVLPHYCYVQQIKE